MENDLNRRRFLGAAAGAGAAVAAGGALAPGAVAHGGRGGHGGWGGWHRGGRVPNDRRGIQLYTLRDAMTNQAEVHLVLNASAAWATPRSRPPATTAGRHGSSAPCSTRRAARHRRP